MRCSLCLSTGFAQDWAKQKLEKSPRHGEWVQIKHDNRTVQAFVVYPETKQKAPVVIVIHEIFGLSDWARTVADQLAANGYIAIAPDFLSGMGPNGGKSSDFPSVDAAREANSKLDPDQVTADLNAVADYAKKIPAGNGKIAVAGFCWGGSQSFRVRRQSQRPERGLCVLWDRSQGRLGRSPLRFMASMPAKTRASAPPFRTRRRP